MGDPFGLVKAPVDTEINATLTILLFGLRERRKSAQDLRPHLAAITVQGHVSVSIRCQGTCLGIEVVARDAIQLIGYESEGDVVGFIESPQNLKNNASQGSMTGCVCREGGREVRSRYVAGLGAHPPPIKVRDGLW